MKIENGAENCPQNSANFPPAPTAAFPLSQYRNLISGFPNSTLIAKFPHSSRIREMSDPSERYVKLGLEESLPRIHRYPLACTELSFILRHAYSKLPKNLQTLLFHDTLSAFRLLPQMQTQNAISAANLLQQSAEAVLPKQKRVLAIAEFKHAKVAYKRRFKSQMEEEGSPQLPQDVLMHIFSFLEMQSLVSVAQVCWSWNLAAHEDSLWQSQYHSFFGNYDKYSVVKGQQGMQTKEDAGENVVASDNFDWRDAFKRAYTGSPSKKFTSHRGYCGCCNTIVWLNNMKCSNRHHDQRFQKQQIKPVSTRQIVEYILDDNPFLIASSESDSDSDDGSISKLWAYPKQH